MEGCVVNLPDRDQVHEVITLKGLRRFDLGDEVLSVLRRPGHAAAKRMVDPQRQLPARRDLPNPGITLAANTDAGGIVDRGEPDAVEVQEGRLDRLDLRFRGNRRETLQGLLHHGKSAVEPPCRLTVRIADDPRGQALRRGLLFGGRAERDAHGLEPRHIHVGVAVERLDEGGPVRRQRVQFREREIRLTVKELRLAPAAEVRDDGIGVRQRLYLLAAAGCHETLPAHGDGFMNGEVVIHGDDLAVDENLIGRLLCEQQPISRHAEDQRQNKGPGRRHPFLLGLFLDGIQARRPVAATFV